MPCITSKQHRVQQFVLWLHLQIRTGLNWDFCSAGVYLKQVFKRLLQSSCSSAVSWPAHCSIPWKWRFWCICPVIQLFSSENLFCAGPQRIFLWYCGLIISLRHFVLIRLIGFPVIVSGNVIKSCAFRDDSVFEGSHGILGHCRSITKFAQDNTMCEHVFVTVDIVESQKGIQELRATEATWTDSEFHKWLQRHNGCHGSGWWISTVLSS